ncbi:hypothetical protein XENORESO_009280 [Xenotaenia resolanae]|uniref:Myb-like domain-containing protein n=1 Tax=Xenotaenia resolanae TaxID=208358 RepID=A0ABV0X1Y0_9TELE
MSEIKMDGVESDAETTQWTRENLEKLLASMKDSIPKKGQTQTYIRGLRALEWDKVAFPPFSPEECRVKWNSMMGKVNSVLIFFVCSSLPAEMYLKWIPSTQLWIPSQSEVV